MPEKEKVIKGLKTCTSIQEGDDCPRDCPYYQSVCFGYDQLMRDALALIIEQDEEIESLREDLRLLKYGDKDTTRNLLRPAT